MKDEDGSKTAGGGALNIPLQSNLADLKYFSGKTSPGGNFFFPPLRGGSRAPQHFQSSSTQLPYFQD